MEFELWAFSDLQTASQLQWHTKAKLLSSSSYEFTRLFIANAKRRKYKSVKWFGIITH